MTVRRSTFFVAIIIAIVALSVGWAVLRFGLYFASSGHDNLSVVGDDTTNPQVDVPAGDDEVRGVMAVQLELDIDAPELRDGTVPTIFVIAISQSWRSAISSRLGSGSINIQGDVPRRDQSVMFVCWSEGYCTEALHMPLAAARAGDVTQVSCFLQLRRPCLVTLAPRWPAKVEGVEGIDGVGPDGRAYAKFSFTTKQYRMVDQAVVRSLVQVDDPPLDLGMLAQRLADVDLPVFQGCDLVDDLQDTLVLPEGTRFQVAALADGYIADERSGVSIYPQTDVLIDFKPSATLRVTVVDSEGKPVKAASCRLDRVSDLSPRVNQQNTLIASGYTNERGEWLSRARSDVGTRILATSPHGIASEDLLLSPGSNHVRLTLGEGAVFSGQFVDDRRMPISGLTLHLEAKAGAYTSTTTTDTNGVFTFHLPEFVESARLEILSTESGLPAKHYFEQTSLNDFSRSWYAVPSTNVEVMLARRAPDDQPVGVEVAFSYPRKPLKGKVRLEGDYLRMSELFPGAMVPGTPLRAQLPAGGGDIVLAPGYYRIRAVEDGYRQTQLVSHYQEFWVRDQETRRLSFDLKEGLLMTVRVLDESSKPIVGLPVTNDGLFWSGDLKTDDRGCVDFSFQAEGVHTVSTLGGGYFLGHDNLSVVNLFPNGGIVDIYAKPSPIQISVKNHDDNVVFVLSPILRYSVLQAEEIVPGEWGFRNVRPGTWHIQAWTRGQGSLITGHRVDLMDYAKRITIAYKDGKFIEE